MTELTIRTPINLPEPASASSSPGDRKRMLVISHVLPFPPRSGQQQRVALTLRALGKKFHVTFVTAANHRDVEAIRRESLNHCDEAIVLPSRTDDGPLLTIGRRICGAIYCLLSGEKWSNYVIGRLQFSPTMLQSLARSGQYDCVLYEYWHANASTTVFRARGIPVVLDMHNILWQARDQQLKARRWLPTWLHNVLVWRYRRREERAWRRYDGIIAINEAERRHTAGRVNADSRIFHVPMGIPLDVWTYQWQPAEHRRIAYYGGLGSVHNRRAAIDCVQKVMPIVWAEFPDAELWLVGSNPPPEVRALSNSRIKVTGFVEDVPSVLSSMTAMLCPWQGTYGFRSRVVEAMAIGLPVIATPDAVYGMELEPDQGLLLASDPYEMGMQVIRLLREPALAYAHSLAAHRQVSARFDFSETYGRLALELERWLETGRETA